ncbi:MAG TPA: hypothetical protein VGO07_02985 [Candidatus Saccharimonadales bacterium]|jgi:hypothetical protein|nr:hypothetical protein [Candidatus Saccharimonadales bacterium]
MSQATLEAPILDVQQIEVEAIYAAEYEQQTLAPAPEMTEATIANDPNDFLGSRGLGGFRHLEISNPNNPNMHGTVQEALKVCPAFRKLVETVHEKAGEEAAIGVLTGLVTPPSVSKQEPAKKTDAKIEKEKPKKPEPKAAEKPVETVVEQPVIAEVKPAPPKPTAVATPAVQKTEITALAAKPESEAVPIVLPLPVAVVERAPIKIEPTPVVTPIVRVEADKPEPTVALRQLAAEHATIPTPTAETTEPVSIPLNTKDWPTYVQSKDRPPAGVEIAAEQETNAVPPVAEATEVTMTPGIDIVPAEPIDLSAEVNALLIELGLSTDTAPEPDYGAQEITTPETTPEGALLLPQPVPIEAVAEISAEPVSPTETVAILPAETLPTAEDLPIIFQTELAERIETLSIEQVAGIQPVADALLQAAVEIDELQLTPAASLEEQAERQIAAEQNLEELCVDLLEALGLPADNETIKRFSKYLLKTEQSRHILHIGREQTEEGTHERLRSSLAWLQHLVKFIQDQVAARHKALGWSALRLSAPRFMTA